SERDMHGQDFGVLGVSVACASRSFIICMALRTSRTDEAIIDIMIPPISSQGLVPKWRSKKRPPSAKSTSGIVMVYPNCQAYDSAFQNAFLVVASAMNVIRQRRFITV